MDNSETIVVRLPNWVGDVIMATPTLRALRNSFPGARIIAVGKSWARDLLSGHPSVDEVIGFPFQSSRATLLAMAGLIRTLRRTNATHSLLFPNSFGAALLFAIAGMRDRIGYATNGRSMLLNRPLAPPQERLHQLDYFLGLMNGFSDQQDWDRTLYLPVTTEKQQEAERLWHSWDVQASDVVIGLNPGAAWGSSKRWLPEYFAQAGDLFQKERGAKIVIFGGPEDVPLANEIAYKMETPPLVIAGRDNLRILPALIARCDLFITNDTGPMHIAASQNVAQVVLFGPTDPLRTAYVRENTRIMQNRLDCVPCFKQQCPLGHHNCMAGISPAQVFDAGSQLLSRST